MINLRGKIKVIAFDADDTLWENQPQFDNAEDRFCEILSAYGPAEDLRSGLYATEMRNMELLGYGSMAFTLSMIEAAINLSLGKVAVSEISDIQELGRSLLRTPHDPMPGVEETLAKICDSGLYKMILFTKGDNREQERKIRNSGLEKYFSHVEIVSDKTEKAYARLVELFGVRPSEFLMVGNSFKSDIAPVLKIGGWGIHIPFRSTWAHELIEEFDHPQLFRLEDFEDILRIVL